jgi:CRP-like cAMP-binding protein
MEQDPVFVSSVVPFLTPLLLRPEEMLYQEGEYADEIYFIYRGRISYVLGNRKITYKVMTTGTYLGEIEVLEQIPRLDTTIAPVECDLFVMTKSLLADTAANFPTIIDEMRKLAANRKTLNAKAKNDIKKLIKTKQAGVDAFKKALARIER